MSAIVCGGKRSFFEELPSSSPPLSKKLRFSPSSSSSWSGPTSFVPPSSSLHHLMALFPDVDDKVLEKTLEECGDDLDLAIKSLNELRLGSAANKLENAFNHFGVHPQANDQPQGADDKRHITVEDPLATENCCPTDGAEWVELFVREMMNAANLDDARARAARALEALEKSVSARAGAEAAKNFQQENVVLKEQVQLLLQENTILKRAVSIQHERQKEFVDKEQELQYLKQLVAQYQDQVRTLEVNNYALAMHLKQAQQGSSFPGGFNPDVF